MKKATKMWTSQLDRVYHFAIVEYPRKISNKITNWRRNKKRKNISRKMLNQEIFFNKMNSYNKKQI